MVLDPTTNQMLNASRPGAGSGTKKRGRFRRSKSSGRRTLGPPSEGSSLEAVEGEAAVSEAASKADAPAEVEVEGAPTDYHHNDQLRAQAAKNVRLQRLSYPVALSVGGGILFGGMMFGLATWMAALAASVGATVVYKVIDSRIG